ncbi:WD domain-containing protein, G-beta repeat-containing protein [Saccharopolyspora kobensis]|uniref:WD domain-containing protein, G-beta repeat-containing protein n=1 Tax=Saccharopolyspora kobensis TaxID=146035 RepID=A0A1H6ED44_9PSEU|nr:caspase family protein [Saccharopolyspora kobensis]SEG95682.1 WD domain-containing protein, G-beta repeat-containing protein [Saccharopolyspora kobensis]SFD54124.1 WD domain-containing protein, G-beta repeat-containing protein [Saccharopolyspora kobensis]
MAGARRALLIATSTYADAGFDRLRAPETDVTGLRRVLADPSIGGYQVELLRDPAHQDAMLAVEDLYADAGPDDLVLLYVSGHGVKDDDGRLYLAMTNSRPDRLSSTAIPVTFLHDRMAGSRSRAVVVWLDCCFSGAFPRGYLVRAADRHANIKEQLLRGGGAANAFADDESRGYAVMTASTALQHSAETDGGAIAPSLFTRQLIEGLRTGDADRDRDGAVGVGELYQYVFERLRGGPGHRQPTLHSRIPGELRIANNPNRPAPDEVPEPIARRSRWPIWAGLLAVVVIGTAAAIAGPQLRDRFAAPEGDPPQPVVLQHTSDVGDVSISPDGALVATASGRTGGADQGGQVQLWDARSGRRVAEFTDQDLVQAVQFSPDGSLLATGTWEDVVRLYDVAGRRQVGVLAGHGAHITGVAFSSDGRLLASTGADGQVRVWDVREQREITTVEPGQRCSSPAFGADARLLVASCESGVRVWEVPSRAPVAVIGGAEVIAFDRAGSLVLADERGGVRIWADGGRADRPLLPSGSVAGAGDVALDPSDDATLAASTGEGEVQIWDVRQRRVVSTLTGRTGAIRLIEFSADGRLLATASTDRAVRLWPVPAP